MRIGIFGGSFNPLHQGHLRLAREAMSELNLARVIFVPSYITPFKDRKKLLPPAVRLRILKAVLRKIPGFCVSACEIKRGGLSYTVDTLRYFKRKFGSGSTLYFLSGTDVLHDVARWKSPQSVFRLCRFVVMTRPGARRVKVDVPVFHMPLDALDISATDIRWRAAKGKPLCGLVPAAAKKILKTHFNRQKQGGRPYRTR